MMHIVLHFAGDMLYPFMHGYMNAKYRKKMHVSLFRDYIVLMYARADGNAIVITVDEATSLDRKSLAAWFHARVAEHNPDEVIPPLAKFRKAAEAAHALAHGGVTVGAAAVPRISRPQPE